MTVTCPCCKQLVDENASFCDICGAPLKEQSSSAPCSNPSPESDANAVPAEAIQTPVETQTFNCPQCGAAYLPGEIFCNECGVQLPPVAVASPAPPIPISPAIQSPPEPEPEPIPVEPAAQTSAESESAATVASSEVTDLEKPATPQPEGTVSASEPSQVQSIPTSPQGPFINGNLTVQASGQTIALPPRKTEILIGRIDPVSSIFPDIDTTPHGGIEKGVSRKHCRLMLDGETVYVEDLGSANFTFINRVRLQPGQQQPIHPGDELRLGGLVYTYTL